MLSLASEIFFEQGLFSYLDSLLERYRSDVHRLFPAASSNIVLLNQNRLGVIFDPKLVRLMKRCNGAHFFRGMLRLRPLEEWSTAHLEGGRIILFADGDEKSWACAHMGNEEFIYGEWKEGTFSPYYSDFDSWIKSSLELLHLRIDHREELDFRLKIQPEHGLLLYQKALHILNEDSPERFKQAQSLLQFAYEQGVHIPRLFVVLGDLQFLAKDGPEVQIQEAELSLYRKALENLSFPMCFQEELPMGFDFLKQLVSAAYKPEDTDASAKAMLQFWEERVVSISSFQELLFVEKLLCVLAEYLMDRTHFAQAKQLLSSFLDKAAEWPLVSFSSQIPLLLADMLIASAEHDRAEQILQPLIQQNLFPSPFAVSEHLDVEKRLQQQYLWQKEQKYAEALLKIGRITTYRQEPWGIEILEEVLESTDEPRLLSEAELLLGENAILMREFELAKEHHERAIQIAKKIGHLGLEGAAELALGMVARLQRQVGTAQKHYERVNTILQSHSNEFLAARFLLRKGNLEAHLGNEEKGIQSIQMAIDSFDALEMPLQGAWSRLCLTEIGVTGAASEAKEIFRELSCAAGFAYANSFIDNSSFEINWHLNIAQQYARKISRAQRSIPPYTRAHADTFERRLGAHRIAISRSGDEIVQALGEELVRLSKILKTQHVFPSNHNLARYKVVADFLSSHQSYLAAEIMSAHLDALPLKGSVHEHFLMALARTRNIQLIHKLLEQLETSNSRGAVVLAAEVMGLRREKEAIALLIERLTSKDIEIVLACVLALGRIGDKEVVPILYVLLERISSEQELGQTGTDSLQEQIAIALLMLGEWKGLDLQAQSIIQPHSDPTRTLGEMVGRFGGASYLLLLKKAALEIEGTQGLGAIIGLGYLGDPRIAQTLIQLTGHRIPNIAQVSGQALELLTGHFESHEEPLLRARWSAWWEEHKHRFHNGNRYRHGQLMTPKVLIDGLKSREAIVRRYSYDELVVSTGVRIPFDCDGPWRIQQRHLKRWMQWWEDNATSYVPGSWYFQGELID